MYESIEKMKERVCERLYLAIEERGPERMDINEVGKLADIVKDLAQAMESCAEAQYYGKIADAMGQPQGAGTGSSAVPEQSKWQYRDTGSYQQYGDPMENIRETLNSAPAHEKERIMRELRSLVR